MAHLGDGRYATDWTVPDWQHLHSRRLLRCGLRLTAPLRFTSAVVTVNAWRLPSSTPSTSGGRSPPESESPLSDGTAITSGMGWAPAQASAAFDEDGEYCARKVILGFGP